MLDISMRSIITVAVSAFAIGTLAPAEEPIAYDIVPIGPFWPAAMNDAGDIVGSRDMSSDPNAILWRNGELIDLPGLDPDDVTRAHAINDHGRIAGDSGTTAVIWDDSLQPVALGDRYQTEAFDINNSGVVVGRYWEDFHLWRAVVWSNGEQRLLHLPEWYESTAFCINDRGAIGGFARRLDRPGFVGVIWDENGIARELDYLSEGMSPVSDLNESGDWTGVWTQDEQAVVYAVVSQVYQEMHRNDGEWSVTITAIDESGRRVLGGIAPAGAMLWEDQRPLDLNSFVDQTEERLEQAVDVSDSGVILARQAYLGRADQSVLLIPRFSLRFVAPAVANETLIVEARGGAHNEEIRIYSSLAGPGQTELPELNVTLDLDAAQLVWSGPADEIGLARYQRELDRLQSDRDVWFQAVRLNETTNVLATTIQPFPFDLDVSPLNAGQPAFAEITSAAPDEPVYLLISRRGDTLTRLPWLHLSVQLDRPILVDRLYTDDTGAARADMKPGDGNRGRVIWVQAAQVGGRSNLIVTQVN